MGRIAGSEFLRVSVLFSVVIFIAHFPSWIGWVQSNPEVLFGNIATRVVPGIIPGIPFLDPNVAYTSQTLGHLAAFDWLHGRIPWWNPYEGIGVPLTGEMQAAAFFPVTLLLIFAKGQLYARALLQFIGGLATYYLFRQMGLSRWASLVGGILFALNGTFAWFGHAPANPVAFLPLLILGVERVKHAATGHLPFGWRVFGMALALSIVAGFPETAYIDALFAAIWALARLPAIPPTGRRLYIGKLSFGSLLGLGLSAPVLVAFGDYLPHAYVGAHNAGFAQAHLSLTALSTLWAPYLYGPPAALSPLDPSGQIGFLWGGVGGYSTVLVILLAFIGLGGQSYRGIRLATGGWVILSLAKTFGNPWATVLFNVIPLIKDAAFFRYAPPSWEFGLVVLATLSLEDIFERKEPVKIRLVAALLASAALVGWSLHMSMPVLTLVFDQHVLFEVFAVSSIVWALLSVALLLLAILSKTPLCSRLAGTMLILDAMAMFLIPRFSNARAADLDNSAIAFLQSHIGLYRIYTMGPLAPNYGSYYRIAEINNNDLPIAANWAGYVQSHLDSNTSRILFTGQDMREASGPTPGEALVQNLTSYERLGVRYVLAPRGFSFEKQVMYGSGSGTGNIALTVGRTKLRGTLFVTTTGKISAVQIFIGTYGGTANGVARIKVQGPSGTDFGTQVLTHVSDNSFMTLKLAHLLPVVRGETLTFSLSQTQYTHPFAVWVWPSQPGLAVQNLGINGKPLTARTLYAGLQYGSSIPLPKLVYQDSTLSIYKLADPRQLFSIQGRRNAERTLVHVESVNNVVITASRPVLLVRRELYLPGWQADSNGLPLKVTAYDKIFQKVSIPAGTHSIRFVYVPPHSSIALGASVLALIILALTALPVRLREWLWGTFVFLSVRKDTNSFGPHSRF